MQSSHSAREKRLYQGCDDYVNEEVVEDVDEKINEERKPESLTTW